MKKNTFRLLICLLLPLIASYAQEVTDVIDLGRNAGPGGTAAYLSPDGSRYAHLDRGVICLYTLPENEEEACFELDENINPHPESGRWSPNGRYFAFVDNPTFERAIDSDIQILDVEANEIRNITDDGYTGRFISPETEEAFTLDIAVAWSDDNQLAVLNYLIQNIEGSLTARVNIIDPITNENTLLFEHELDMPYMYFTLAWRSDTIAIGQAPPDRNYARSIDLFDAQSGELIRQIFVSEDLVYAYSLQFSADGNYLLAYNPAYRAQYGASLEPTQDGMMIIGLEDDVEINIDNNRYVIQAGFAPVDNKIMYVVQNPLQPELAGVYIASAVWKEPQLVYEIERPDATTPRSTMPIIWASNNTIMIRDNETQHAILLVLEENE